MTRRLALLLMGGLVACSAAPPPVGLPAPVGPVMVRIGIEPADLWTVLEEAPASSSERRAALSELFRTVGCDDLEAGESRAAPVVCRLPGETSRTVLVTSDYSRAGMRTSDGWPGAAMLPGLYHSLAVEPRHHTFVFVAFDRPRVGPKAERWPVSRALDALRPEERTELEAVVGVRGLNEYHFGVVRTGADPGLFVDLHTVGESLSMPVKNRRAQRPSDLMGEAKLQRGDPAPVPGLSVAVAERGLSDYLDSFRIMAAFLAYVDEAFERRRAEGPPVPR